MLNFKTNSLLALAALLLWSGPVSATIIDCETKPGSCELEPIVQEDAHYEISIIPGAYEWQDGVTEGYALEYEVLPTKWKVEEATVTVTPAVVKKVGVRNIKTPAVSKKVKRRIVTEHAQPLARLKPFEIKDGRTRVQVTKPKVVERRIPAKLVH